MFLDVSRGQLLVPVTNFLQNSLQILWHLRIPKQKFEFHTTINNKMDVRRIYDVEAR
jgi:hypothetical protein